jgi:hypothetical protein
MSEPNTHDSDPVLAALLAWRQQLIDSGAVSANSFKEAHVRMVRNSGLTNVEEIRKMLPGAVAEHAEEMARILIEASATEDTTDDVVEDTGIDAAPDGEKAAVIGTTPRPRGKRARGTEETVLTPDSFAPFTVTEQTSHPAPLGRRRSEDGALQLSWPPYEAPFVVYRVVSAEQDPPYSPDLAHRVAVTRDTSALDDRGATSAVRHLQVWANAGASEAEALGAQPLLHAAGVVVSTVTDLAVREDSGQVIGQWTVFPGIRAVHVYRVPVEEADAAGPQHRILAGDANLGGFIDSCAEHGRRYVYRFRCEAAVDAAAPLSEALQVEVTVSGVLTPVTDLALTMYTGDQAMFDLAWTPPPAGRVLIFRTKTAPTGDAGAVELPEAALEQTGLALEQRLTHPIAERRDPQGRTLAVMADVPWPADWSRAYFTPVTILNGQIRLGRTTSSVRTGVIQDVELVEYCNKQVLTFAWPPGAASVVTYLAPRDHDPGDGLSGRSYEISHEDYEKYGGMQFSVELPAGGCSLHLAPVAFSAGRRVQGAVTSILYPGLLRVNYAVEIDRDRRGAPLTARVSARAQVDVQGSPPFRLVHHAERIPLSVNDGDPVDVAPLDAQGNVAAGWAKVMQFSSLGTAGGGETWAGDVRGRTGWIRLFADLADAARLRHLALLDPPVSTLRLTQARP